MTWQHSSLHLAALSVATALGLFITPRLPIQAQNIPLPAQQAEIEWVPQDRGAPDESAGASSRDEGRCPQDKEKPNPPLTALIPIKNRALTLAKHPTFFIYIPPTAAQTAEFVIKDNEDNDIYRKTFSLTGKPGIISISLPTNVTPLEIGKNYLWYFDVICSSGKRLVLDRLTLQRTVPNPTFADMLKNAKPRDRAALYAKNGIWYDTLQTLAELRRSTPNDAAIAADWKTILEATGLNAIADQPLVECCTLQN